MRGVGVPRRTPSCSSSDSSSSTRGAGGERELCAMHIQLLIPNHMATLQISIFLLMNIHSFSVQEHSHVRHLFLNATVFAWSGFSIRQENKPP